MRAVRTRIPVLVAVLAVAGCGGGGGGPDTGLANPASVYCEAHGGTLEIRADGAGAQTGFCVFENGGGCEEWAVLRGECTAGG